MFRLSATIIFFSVCSFVLGLRSRIQLIDNGYEGLVIAVNEKCGATFSVAEAEDILNGIEVSSYSKRVSRIYLVNL